MKNILITLTTLAAVILGVYSYLGGFSKVPVTKVQAGPFHILYLEHMGPYKNVGGLIKKVNELLDTNSIGKTAMFGIYYDNPASVEEEKLRSIVGAIVNDEGLAKAQKLIEKGGIKQSTIGRQVFVRTEFPFRNRMSMLIAISKVYPVLNRYSSDHGFPEYRYKESGYEDNFIMEVYYKDYVEYLMTTPGK